VQLPTLEQSSGLDRLNVQALLHVAVAHLRLIVRALGLLGNAAALVGQFDHEFRHVTLVGDAAAEPS
jgi:hypothetical protein